MKSKFTKWVLITTLIFGVLTWVFLFEFFFDRFMVDMTQPISGIHDVSSRLMSPNGERVALLVRNYDYDLNFRLYITDDYFAEPPFNSSDSLWLSYDYNPDDRSVNLHEDLEWSQDSSVIAVIIDGEHVFAYDFSSSKKIEDQEGIKKLFESRIEQ